MAQQHKAHCPQPDTEHHRADARLARWPTRSAQQQQQDRCPFTLSIKRRVILHDVAQLIHKIKRSEAPAA
ncbi:hypothetical protein LTR17_024462 [Elasticomyces elasticus]|nr:hypothetical protein LTR17_024462 [Elasticomyces elasticus]